MSSDLSQLLINQQNKVSLYVDGNIKINDVYLPRDFTNYTGDTTNQPVVLGVDNVESGVIARTALYQKGLFSAQGLNTPQDYTSAQVGANQNIIFGVGTQVVNQNGGVFTPSTGILSVVPNGLYRITYSMTKSGNATCVEGSCSVGIIVDNVTYGELQCPLGTLSANSGASVVSNSVLVYVTGGEINLYYNTNISAGEASINNPSLTVEFISPYSV